MVEAATVHLIPLFKLNGVKKLSLFLDGYKVVSPSATDLAMCRAMASNAQSPVLAQPQDLPNDSALQPSALRSVLLHYHVLPECQWTA